MQRVLTTVFIQNNFLQVGKVETAKDKSLAREWVSDELSTLPGAMVTVSPFGSVRIKRKAGNFISRQSRSWSFEKYKALSGQRDNGGGESVLQDFRPPPASPLANCLK